MVLLGDFFNVISADVDGCGIRNYTVEFNAGHFIYKAHFPGEPITPGVCILQASFELLQQAVGKALELSEVKNVKFLKIISPIENPVVSFTINKLAVGDNGVSAQITAAGGEDIFSKLSLICRVKD